MNAIQFDDRTKAAEITYEQLEQTMELGMGTGEMPKQCPVQPGTLIRMIANNVEKFAGLKPKVQPIVIREPYCNVDRKRLTAKEDLRLEDYLIRRLVTRIDIPLEAFEGTNDHMNAAIVMSYAYTDSTKGIQIAFGENVNVCENLATFGGFSFSTYGESKVGFDDGMQLMSHWMQNLNKVHDKHIKVIADLKTKKVARQGFQRILGAMFEKAVRANSGERIHAPLTQTQISAMVHEGLPVLKSDADHVNGWEMMNWGNRILKPHTSDMLNLIRDTSGFNTFLCNELKVEMDLAI